MDSRQASQIIMQEVDSNPASAQGGGVKDDFCAVWPKAKPILDLLAGIALLIPGLGATAGAVLRGLIKVGDQIAQDTCT